MILNRPGLLEALGYESRCHTLADLIAATGWLSHATRAALTGLRKKGQTAERLKHDGATTYRIVGR